MGRILGKFSQSKLKKLRLKNKYGKDFVGDMLVKDN